MNKPPHIARWILSVTNRKSNREIVLGDFEEMYDEVCKERGKLSANIWYYKQAFISIPKFLFTSFFAGGNMFSNYLKTAFRNIIKQKGYSIINITGLAFGIACCMLITIFVMFEVSYDNYHKDNYRIFRIVEEFKDQNGIYQTTRSGAPLGPALNDNFPQVQYYARMLDLNKGLVKKDDISFYEDKNFFTDNDIFKILTIPFLQGDPNTALQKPSTVVITESIAKKYFGNENPLGKTITRGTREYEITGVTADQPKNSHIHFNILMSLKTLELYSNYPFEPWFVNNFNTYIKLEPNVDAESFSKQIAPVLYSYYKDELGVDESLNFKLQPVKDIHLYSHFGDELEPPGNPVAITIFTLVSIFILLIACINFMNLSTAKSAMRAKEIGVRKVNGADRKQLIAQFISEAAVMSLISVIFALFLIFFSLPMFNKIAGTGFDFSDFINPVFALGLAALTIFVTLAAGSYPAFMLSSFRPVDVLKKNFSGSGKGALMRRILVVSQYTISILMIICSMIIYTQINFMHNKDLGFDKEQKLILPVRERVRDRHEMIKSEFMKFPSVINASFSSTVPGRDLTGIWTTSRADQPDQSGINNNFYYIDPDFIEQYDIRVLAGRPFQKEISTDMNSLILLNETAVTAFGWASPQEAIGNKLIAFDSAQTIIGVIKDFNYMGLQTSLQPMIMEWRPSQFGYLTLSLQSGNIHDALTFAENKWEEIFPGIPYEYFFLDDNFQSLYETEENFGRLIGTFTFLALMIASLGLFGLASFMTERRTKEIGVRKVLGATIPGIIILLSREFIKWVVIANIIAFPVAYYIMNKWLQSFAYRIEINFLVFIIAGIAALIIAVGTVTYQSVKAAAANPVDSLKYE